jgi:dihydroorotate dehydrogenase (fumarate)/dihydroorotate dehydrogenase
LNLYQSLVRPALFQLDAEFVHEHVLRACGQLGRSALLCKLARAGFGLQSQRLNLDLAGLSFPNPICLAAGFDKNGHAINMLSSAGFGALEIGSISQQPSAGNPERPRLHRLPKDEGLVVFYGVPNDGAERVATRIAGTPALVQRPPLGISLVETNTGSQAPVDAVIEQLQQCARHFIGLADYFAINLHCPNSPGGKGHFQNPQHLAQLLQRLNELPDMPPTLLKIAPDHDDAGIDAVLAAVDGFGFVRGFIMNAHAKNPRAGLRTAPEELQRMRGAISGWTNREAAFQAVAQWSRRIDRKRHILVGVGSLTSGAHVWRMLTLGASLVQVCTGLVYHGPGLVKSMKRELLALMDRHGVSDVGTLIGNAALAEIDPLNGAQQLARAAA